MPPCLKSIRITVYDILDYLIAEMAAADIVENYPPLKEKDVKAVINYVKQWHSQNKYVSSTGAATLLDHNLSYKLVNDSVS